MKNRSIRRTYFLSDEDIAGIRQLRYCFNTLLNKRNVTVLQALFAVGSMSVREIQGCLGREQADVSQVLGRFSKAGLVIGTRKGRRRIYSVDKKQLLRLLKLAGDLTQPANSQ